MWIHRLVIAALWRTSLTIAIVAIDANLHYNLRLGVDGAKTIDLGVRV